MTDLTNLPYDCKCPVCGRQMVCERDRFLGGLLQFRMRCGWWYSSDSQPCGVTGPIRDSEHDALLAMESLGKSDAWHYMRVPPKKWCTRVLLSQNGFVILGRYERNPTTLKPSYFTGCGWFHPEDFDYWRNIPVAPARHRQEKP